MGRLYNGTTHKEKGGGGYFLRLQELQQRIATCSGQRHDGSILTQTMQQQRQQRKADVAKTM